MWPSHSFSPVHANVAKLIEISPIVSQRGVLNGTEAKAPIPKRMARFLSVDRARNRAANALKGANLTELRARVTTVAEIGHNVPRGFIDSIALACLH